MQLELSESIVNTFVVSLLQPTEAITGLMARIKARKQQIAVAKPAVESVSRPVVAAAR